MFEYQEKGHKYFLDGKPMTGVTTILGVIAKPALIQWAANMAVDYIAEHIGDVLTFPIDKEKTEKFLKEARTAHAKKKTDAGKKGTDVHKEIENIITWALTGNGVIPKEYVISTNYEIEDVAKGQIQKFLDWAVGNKVKFLASEKKVYSEKLWYAGTLDFLCEIDGKKYIGDLKTSSGIYGREYFFQCAAYRQAAEEMGETDFHGSIIVRCGKDGSFETKDSFDYETDVKGFNAALQLYRIIN